MVELGCVRTTNLLIFFFFLLRSFRRFWSRICVYRGPKILNVIILLKEIVHGAQDKT